MNQKLTLTPDAEPSDDVAVPSDDAVRQALLRMGSNKQRQGGHGGGSGQTQHERSPDRSIDRSLDRPFDRQSVFSGGGQRRGGDQLQVASSSPDARRRRFSQNEHVPVEYVSRDRPARGGEPLRLDVREAPDAADDRTGFLERELERERQARSAAERFCDETKTALTAARTRIAHLEIDLEEARAQRQAMIDLAQSAAQQAAQHAAAQHLAAQHSAAQHSAAQHTEPRAALRGVALSQALPGVAEDEDDLFTQAAAPVRRGRGRPRRVPVPVDAEAEPEPVKWWSDD